MGDQASWQAFLKQTFTTIKNERLAGLVIDLRTNTGGDSRLGDDLLAYLTEKSYRSITRKDWRFSPPYVAQLNPVDPWGFALGNADEEPPADFKALLAQRPPIVLRTALRDRAPLQVKRILERHAPHWLQTDQTSVDETEILTLEFTTPTTPPAEMPLRFRGSVVFLIGPDTFSSAVILANTVEDFHLAPLIGEETKPCNQFGEPCFLELPNSRLRLAIATAQYVRANGDASSRHGVLPSIVVSPSEPSMDPSRDAVLLRAQEFIHNSQGPSK
jgi:C-terminal processing protease CtpA/Prc